MAAASSGASQCLPPTAGGALDDATLVARAREGDLGAFEALVARYQRRIYQLALRMTASSADAEDITQEVFLIAWRRLPQLEVDAAFVGWLYRTATNRCLNLLRRWRPTAELDIDTAVSSVVAAELGAPRGGDPVARRRPGRTTAEPAGPDHGSGSRGRSPH